ncbi:MAG: UDP-glucose 4-epimerase GalE [Vicinamibacterales bacterium]
MAGADRGPVLVTGGAGYIGSHTVKALRRAGRDVIVYDDLSAGHREAALGVPLIVGDVADTAAVARALRETGATAVVHFAAWLAVADSVRDPAGYYRNNVVGALGTLQAMVEVGCRHFVFSSTCAVYGEPVRAPIDESHATTPLSPYGQTKLAIEQALPHFDRAYGLRSVSLRYFNAAGADPDGELGEDHDPEIHLIPRALVAAAGGPPLEIFGDDYPTPDGTCLRDYVHVSDLAEAHLLALASLESDGASATYNVGSGEPSSVRDVMRAVERVTGQTVPCRIAPRRPGDPAVLHASAARIQAALGWRPGRPALDTIVADAWQWYRTHPRGFGPAQGT